MNLLINLMANLRQHIHDRRHNDYVTITYTPPEDELYPMVLKHGYVTVEREYPTEYPIEYSDATPVINADRSLTITRGGEIIGWHDTDTYCRVTTQ